MLNKFIPFAHATSVFEIDPSFFALHGIKTVLIDLDNTLDSFKAHAASAAAIELKERLDDKGINMIIISNNHDKRVRAYADSLGVAYLASAHKPFKKRLSSFLKNRGLIKNEVVIIGDQLITDVLLGYHAGIRVILTEKIVKEDQWTTHFNRLIDRPIRRHLAKKGKLVKWVNVHGKF